MGDGWKRAVAAAKATQKHTHNWGRTPKGIRCAACGAYKRAAKGESA